MPAIRAIHLKHPITQASGIWLELSTQAPGELVGYSFEEWPRVARNETLSGYQTKINILYRNLTELRSLAETRIGTETREGWFVDGDQLVPLVCSVQITLVSMEPVVLDPENGVFVSNGAMREVRVR